MMIVHTSSAVPFKVQINSFDLTKFLKDISGIKFKIENQQLLIEETLAGSLDIFEQFISNIHLNFSIESEPKTLQFEKFTILPRVTKELFFELLSQYYKFNTQDDLYQYRNLVNYLISEITSHIRIVSSPTNQLYLLIDGLRHNLDFKELEPIFTNLLKEQEWANLFKNSSNSLFLKSISINTWLHVLRHPTEAKTNLIKLLQFLSTICGRFPFIITEIPLVDPKGHFILSLTHIDQKIISDSNNFAENEELQEILSYWLTFGSLVLRNLSYALIRFNNLSLDGFTHEDIAFYDYFKPKLNQFSESCFNPDLVNAFKSYDNGRSKMIFSIRGHELYTYNRSSILEFHLKQAQQEFSRFPTKKILRKRVNRRSNKLYTFLNDITYIYKDYLNEISNLTKASGNYTSIDKIIRNDKILN